MTSSVLKCKNCNIVICELLAFVQNKVDVMVEESLVQICSTAFTDEEIEKAKNLLFDSVSKKKSTRRREGKTQRNLDDIICLIKETDPEEIPIFVARDLQKLPPVTFDHVDVTRLLKEIVLIQKDLGVIQNNYAKNAETEYVTIEEFEKLKLEINQLKVARQTRDIEPNVNHKRGGYRQEESFDAHNSGPMGLVNLSDCRHPTLSSYEGTPRITPSRPSFACVVRNVPDPSQLSVLSAAEPARVEAHPRAAVSTAAASERTCEAPPRFPTSSNTENTASVVEGCNSKKVLEPNDGWVTINRKQKKNSFSGRKGTATVSPSCKFKAADARIPLFIYNVTKEASVKDVAEYIFKKTQITVLPQKIDMKVPKDYDSYKIYIPRKSLSLFDDDYLWPNGIFFRRYYLFKNNGIFTAQAAIDSQALQ